MSETTFFSSFGPLEVVAQLLQHHMRLRRVDASPPCPLVASADQSWIHFALTFTFLFPFCLLWQPCFQAFPISIQALCSSFLRETSKVRSRNIFTILPHLVRHLKTFDFQAISSSLPCFGSICIEGCLSSGMYSFQQCGILNVLPAFHRRSCTRLCDLRPRLQHSSVFFSPMLFL